MPNACTVAYNGKANVLKSEAYIWKAFNPQLISQLNPEKLGAKKFTAIWDTGATNSVITQKVVNECSLKPIGMARVHTANDDRNSSVYFASIFLPNKVCFPQLRVTEASITSDADILIGMDIIGSGDFAVTNKDGKTTFSFRTPSTECIDFVKQDQTPSQPIIVPKIGRNSPCPCGSGKKYKRCCGK